MSDAHSSVSVLDPERPWIVDERQLPSRMRWLSALFDPTGKSPKLHFTRVWTVCFFLQLLIVVLPVSIGLVVGLAGGDASSITTFGVYASPVIFILTTIISFVAHSRRLNDAGKWSIWAVLVLIPLFIGFALFTMGVVQKSAEYDELYQQRTEYLEDPRTWRSEMIAFRQSKQVSEAAFQELNAELKMLFMGVFPGRDMGMLSDSAAWQSDTLATFETLKARALELTEETEANQKVDQRLSQRSSRIEQPLPSQADFILRPNLGAIQNILIAMNIFIAIWSLTWVARVPDFGKEKP